MAQNEDYPLDQIPFPEGYEHFASLAQFAALQLRELDARIKAIPVEDIKTTVSRYQLHPGLLRKSVDQWRNRENRASLEAQQQKIEQELNKRIDRDIKTWGIDTDTAHQIKLATVDTLHPNPFAGMSREELARHKTAVKDEYNSESYMRSLLRASKGEPKPTPPKAVSEKPKDQQLDLSKLSFSQRYTLNVSFGSSPSNSGGGGKSKPKDIDKE